MRRPDDPDDRRHTRRAERPSRIPAPIVSSASLVRRSGRRYSGSTSGPNGNTVVTSHHASAGQVKLLEVTRDKKLVWTYTDARKSGIHHFQILDADGKPLKGRSLR